jgi:hypothetical protein
MYKAKSEAMKRGAMKRERTPLTAEERKLFKKTTSLSQQELGHFSFGAVTQDVLLERLAPHVRGFADAGFGSPSAVARMLNKNGLKTACGELWNPQLAWFLLGFLHERRKRLAQEKAAKLKTMRISKAPAAKPTAPLTREELARRLSVLGSIKKG